MTEEGGGMKREGLKKSVGNVEGKWKKEGNVRKGAKYDGNGTGKKKERGCRGN